RNLPDAPPAGIAGTPSNRGDLMLFTDIVSPNTVTILKTNSSGGGSVNIPGWTKDMVAHAVFSANDTIVASRNLNKTVLPISIVDVKTGKEIQAVGDGSTQSFALSPDGNHIAVVSRSPAVQLWDTHTGHVDAELRHLDEVKSVAFSPDGKFIVTASKDQTAVVWDAASGYAVTKLAGRGAVNDAVFDPTSSYIVTISDKNAYLWKPKVR